MTIVNFGTKDYGLYSFIAEIGSTLEERFFELPTTGNDSFNLIFEVALFGRITVS